jgi:hypothetical protein
MLIEKYEPVNLFELVPLERDEVLNEWGIVCTSLGAYQDAKRQFEEPLAIWQALGDQSGIAGSRM